MDKELQIKELNEQIKLAYEYNDYEKIIEICTVLIEFDENNKFVYYFYRGEAKNYSNLFKEAIIDFDLAINYYDKKNSYAEKINIEDIFYKRGISYFILKKYKEAIIDFNVPINIYEDPNKIYDTANKNINIIIDSYNFRGQAKNYSNLYEEAIKDYDKAIALNDQIPVLYFNRGISKYNFEMFNEAIIDFDKAIELKPNYPLYYNNRGLAKNSLKKYEEAIKDFDKAIELNDQLSEIYYNRGIAKDGLNRLNEAIIDFNKAINLNPNYSEAYFNRAYVKFKNSNEDDNGNFEDSKKDYTMSFNTGLRYNVEEEKMVLKFRPINCYTLQLLKDQQIWFAHPSTFNDPLDANFLQKHFSIIKPLKEVLDNFLVISFVKKTTEMKYENLMWSHYAQNHSGICLVYQLNKIIKIPNFYFHNVNYKDVISEPDMNNFETGIKSGFFTKHDIWEYEREGRIIYFPTSEKLAQKQPVKGIAINICDLGIELKEVIFGLKCKQEDRDEIIKIIKDTPAYNKVTIFEMKDDFSNTNNHFLLTKLEIKNIIQTQKLP